jgi:26S proteasome regulatory subunit N13
MPDKRKGKIEINTSPEDQLLHFKWKDRSTGQVETDLIIFPEEAVFKRVKQCTTGRVYLLEWKGTERRLFFWMQEPSEDKDAELCEKVNKALNEPPASEAAADTSTPTGLRRLAAGMTQEQLMALMGMGGGGRRGAAGRTPESATLSAQSGSSASTASQPSPSPASTQTSAASSSASAAPADLGNLQSILRELGAASGGAGQRREESVDLTSVITPEALLPLFNNPQVVEQLLPYLPEGQRSPEELMQMVHSAQFQQALRAFNSALQSGALAEVLPALGLPPSAAAGDVQEFLRALQEHSQRGEGSQSSQQESDANDESGGSGSGGGPKKGDDNMDTS